MYHNTNVIPSMLCYCGISYKRYPFNVMLLPNIVQTLSLQCYVIVEYVIVEFGNNITLNG